MQLRSLAQLALYTRQLLDAEGQTASARHTDTSVYAAVNRGLNAFNRILVAGGGGSRLLASVVMTGTGGALYPLPIDFASLFSLELGPNTYGGTDWLGAMDANESVDERSLAATGGARTGGSRYRILGSNLEVYPQPTTSQTLRIWYVPTNPQLSSPAAMAQSFEDYVARFAARDLAMKDRAMDVHDRLDAQLAAMVPQIKTIARQRDLAAPSRVRDTWGERTRANRRRYF